MCCGCTGVSKSSTVVRVLGALSREKKREVAGDLEVTRKKENAMC